MTVPFLTSSGSPLYVTEQRSAVPSTSSVVSTKVCPFFNSTEPAENCFTRTSGPFVSSIVATGKPSLSRTATNSSNLFLCSSCVACEKLKRATFIPLFINSSTTFGSFVAGPSVQTIFVFLIFLSSEIIP